MRSNPKERKKKIKRKRGVLAAYFSCLVMMERRKIIKGKRVGQVLSSPMLSDGIKKRPKKKGKKKGRGDDAFVYYHFRLEASQKKEREGVERGKL